MIEVSAEQLERVKLILGGIPKAVPAAISNALNRGATTARKAAANYITEHYTLKQKDAREATKIKFRKADNGNIEATVIFSGNVIPLLKFDVRPSTPKAGAVSAAVERHGRKALASAYVTNLGRYGPGVFERLTSKRNTSQQLYGPSTAQMLGTANAQIEMQTQAQETIDKRLEHEIERILAGYGGKNA